MLRYQPDAFIQVTGVSAVISRAVFAAYIVGTVAKAAADASASARLMTGRRHHLHLCGEQGCELHKVSRQANPTPSLKIKRAGVLLLKLRPIPFDITLFVPVWLVPRFLPADGRARPDPAHTPQSAAEHCGSFFPALP